MHNKNHTGKANNRALGKLTLGESHELFTLYLLNSENGSERIKLHFQFWFYFIIVSAFLVNGLLFFGIVLQ